MKDKRYLNSLCYLDTNLFIYLFDNASEQKQAVAEKIYREMLQSRLGRISMLVVSEWRNVMAKKYNRVVTPDIRMGFLQLFEVWKPILINLKTIINSEKLMSRYSLSAYDAIHIQAALDMECKFFLSEDLQNGQVIDDSLTILNPFAELTD